MRKIPYLFVGNFFKEFQIEGLEIVLVQQKKQNFVESINLLK